MFSKIPNSNSFFHFRPSPANCDSRPSVRLATTSGEAVTGSNSLESIGVLEEFLLKHKKDYVDLYRTTEQERDSIEHEVLILSEKLHSVSSQFDHLRALRFQDAINRVAPRRKPRRTGKSSTSEISTSSNLDQRQQSDSEARNPNELQPEPIRVQEQYLDDETRALQVELTGLLDAVQQTETKMVEMSALNHLMSTHVLQQAQQIEYLYDQAVEATKNVELGNKELTKAIQRNSTCGNGNNIVLFLFMHVVMVIFCYKNNLAKDLHRTFPPTLLSVLLLWDLAILSYVAIFVLAGYPIASRKIAASWAVIRHAPWSRLSVPFIRFSFQCLVMCLSFLSSASFLVRL
nr:syntaxin-81-like isoform X1 [Ipomoea batatas]